MFSHTPILDRLFRTSLFVACIGFLAVFCSTSLRAEKPRDELLRYVPESTGFCVVLQDLRPTLQRLGQSEFATKFETSPVGVLLRQTKEYRDLDRLRGQFEQVVGLSLESFVDEMLGDAVAFAYRPGTPDSETDEAGLLLVRAKSAKVLEQLVERFNASQRTSGDLLALEERTHAEQTYFCRKEKRRSTFYMIQGTTFLFTVQEDFLRTALETAKQQPKAIPAVSKHLTELGVDSALLSVWFNPRAFDPHVAKLMADTERVERANEQEKRSARVFTSCWKEFESGALGLVLGEDVQITLGIQANYDELPSGVRDLLGSLAKPTPLWQLAPSDAFFTVGGTFEPKAALEAVHEFLTSENKTKFHTDLDRMVSAVLGKSELAEVAPFLGPDWLMCVHPPTEGAWIPEAFLVYRVQEGDPTSPVDRAVFDALHGLAMMAVLDHNRKAPKRRLTLRRHLSEQGDIRYLENAEIFPQGLQPAFGVNGGYLVVGTSPEVVRRVNVALRTLDPEELAPERPLARLSFRNLRSFLVRHREPLGKLIAEQNNISALESQARLQAILLGLNYFDNLQLSLRTTTDVAKLTVSLRLSDPLK